MSERNIFGRWARDLNKWLKQPANLGKRDATDDDLVDSPSLEVTPEKEAELLKQAREGWVSVDFDSQNLDSQDLRLLDTLRNAIVTLNGAITYQETAMEWQLRIVDLPADQATEFVFQGFDVNITGKKKSDETRVLVQTSGSSEAEVYENGVMLQQNKPVQENSSISNVTSPSVLKNAKNEEYLLYGVSVDTQQNRIMILTGFNPNHIAITSVAKFNPEGGTEPMDNDVME